MIRPNITLLIIIAVKFLYTNDACLLTYFINIYMYISFIFLYDINLMHLFLLVVYINMYTRSNLLINVFYIECL